MKENIDLRLTSGSR